MNIPEECEQHLFETLFREVPGYASYEALGKQDYLAPTLQIHGVPLRECSEEVKLRALQCLIGADDEG